MDFSILLTFLACIFFLFILGKIFIIPLKKILKLIFNSIIGGIIILIINLLAKPFNLYIGLNIFTAIFIGILGIPRSSNFNLFKTFYYIKNPTLADY